MACQVTAKRKRKKPPTAYEKAVEEWERLWPYYHALRYGWTPDKHGKLRRWCKGQSAEGCVQAIRYAFDDGLSGMNDLVAKEAKQWLVWPRLRSVDCCRLGQRIAKLCTVRKLAEVLDVARHMIFRKLYGERPILLSELETLAKHFHLPMGWFFDGWAAGELPGDKQR